VTRIQGSSCTLHLEFFAIALIPTVPPTITLRTQYPDPIAALLILGQFKANVILSAQDRVADLGLCGLGRKSQASSSE